MIQCNETLVRDDRSQDRQNRTAARANRGTLRVWLVDNDQEFCSLLARLLVLGGGIKCPRSFPSAEAVLDALPCEKARDPAAGRDGGDPGRGGGVNGGAAR